MGIKFSSDMFNKQQDLVLIPPVFTRNLKARNRFSESPFGYLFGKAQSNEIFRHYYTAPGTTDVHLDIRPESFGDPQHPVVDFGANVTSGGNNGASNTFGGARFRFQAAEDDPYSFMEVTTSSENKGSADVKFCLLHEGFAVFGNGGIAKQGPSSKHASIGLRYSSNRTSLGLSIDSLAADTLTTWAVTSVSALTLGAQANLKKDINTVWIEDSTVGLSFAYGRAGSVDPGTGAFNPAAGAFNPGLVVALQARKNMSEVALGYYHHLVMNRSVKNPLEDQHVKYITNYIDLGVEMSTSLRGEGGVVVDLGAAWQINKNCMIKTKISNFSTMSTCLAIKSWWNPSITLALTAEFDKSTKGMWGLYCSTENFGAVEYERNTAQHMPRTASSKRVTAPATWKEKPEGVQSKQWEARPNKADMYI